MAIPNLKRIKIASEQALNVWLSVNAAQSESVMLVTFAPASHKSHVSRAQVGEALSAHGWTSGPRYTLNDTLLGHVIHKAAG